MGKSKINKWVVIPPILLISISEALILVPALHKAHYTEALIAGVMSFTWFHLAVLCLKHGIQPWRAAPTLAMASVGFGARAIEMMVDGHVIAALMPVLSCIVWGYTAYRANEARKRVEAEENERF